MSKQTAAAFLVVLGLCAEAPSWGQVELISRVAPDQVSGTATGSAPSYLSPPFVTSLSADGRYVAFVSGANNLVSGQDDRNGSLDAFLRDRVSGVTVLVSRTYSSATTAADLGASAVAVSPDGRYVAWSGPSTNVVPNQPGSPNPPSNVFLFDRISGTNRLLGPGDHPEAFSRDGRFLFFFGNLGAAPFLYDVTAGALTQVSPSSSGTGAPAGSISRDGRYVVFVSGLFHLLVFDRLAGTLEDLGYGKGLPAISADGRYVAFLSDADNLVPGQVDTNGGPDAFIYDRVTHATVLASHGLGSPLQAGDTNLRSQYIALSPDGRYLAFVSGTIYQSPPPTPGTSSNLVLFDRVTGAVRIVAPAIDGDDFDSPAFSGDGSSLVFTSRADVIPGHAAHTAANVYLYDLASGRTVAVTAGTAVGPFLPDSDSFGAAISDDGRIVAFTSRLAGLVPGLEDLNEGEDRFAYTVPTGSTELVTARSAASATPARGSRVESLSADGRWTAFTSASSHLISGQEDHQTSIYQTERTDVFLYDAQARSSILVSRSNGRPTTAGNDDSVGGLLSPDGRYVAFSSWATDLTPAATEASQQSLFLFDRTAGTSRLVDVSLSHEALIYANAEAFSADGRFLAFTSNGQHLVPGQTPGTPHSSQDVFLSEVTTGALTLVSRSAASAQTTGDQESTTPSLSADGRYTLFLSRATNLVPGQTGSNRVFADVFLYDRVTGATSLVSHTRGAPAAASGAADLVRRALSADGRYAVFTSTRADLAANATGNTFGGNLYLYDRATGANALLLTVPQPGRLANAVISADGRIVAVLGKGAVLPGQTGSTDQFQLFLYDRTAGTLTLASRGGSSATAGLDSGASDPALSSDGRYVTFLGGAPTPLQSTDLRRFDRMTGATVLISPSRRSPGNSLDQLPPFISADGQTVAFTSTSPDLVPGDFNGSVEDAFLFHAASTPPPGPVAVTPCTLLDTRRPADRPALRSNVRRSVKARGTCGVPATAKSVVVKVTALQGTGQGNLQLFPGGSTASAGILRFSRGQTRSASYTVPVGPGGAISILPYVAGNGTVQAAVEVDAYVP